MSTSGTVDTAKAQAMLECMRDAGAVTDAAEVTYLEQLQGGWSRHSYAARVADAGGERAYVVRAQPSGSTLDTDLEQEFRVFELLVPEPVPTPAVHGFAHGEPGSPFDGPFFVMDRLDGDALNVWRRRDRDVLQADWDGPRAIAEDFVVQLAAIHRIDPERAARAATPRSFTELVDHWQGVYEEQRLVRDPILDETYRWVRSREPDPVEPALVHADYRIGNCLIAGGHITATLDWELAYVGDPRFDLGYMSLPYHRGKFTTPGSDLVGAVAEEGWFDARYTELTGRLVDREVVRTFTAIGALMLAAIMTTGLRVAAEGRSSDIRLPWARFVLPGLRQDLAGLMGW